MKTDYCFSFFFLALFCRGLLEVASTYAIDPLPEIELGNDEEEEEKIVEGSSPGGGKEKEDMAEKKSGKK